MKKSEHLVVVLVLDPHDPSESRTFANKVQAKDLAGEQEGGLNLLHLCKAVLLDAKAAGDSGVSGPSGRVTFCPCAPLSPPTD